MQPSTPSVRPQGVTILAILAAIGGVLGIFGGLAALFGGAVIGGLGGGALGGLLSIIGLVALVQSALELAFAYGAWRLQPWAWTLGVAAAVISLVISVLWIIGGQSLFNQAISIVIAAVILYYLNTPEVKRAFGRP
jgi:hypothetical protein